ncbi:MAG: hypothetical protein ACREHD_20735 [Pirellulales bacterium]
MNPFRKILNDFGWTTSPSRDSHAWLYLLLAYSAAEYDANSESSVDSDPYREALRRWDFAGPALTEVERIFHGVGKVS